MSKTQNCLTGFDFFFQIKKKKEILKYLLSENTKSLIETQATTHMNTQQYGSEMQS